MLCASANAQTQAGYWSAQEITTPDFRAYNPQIAIDRWGNTHLMWASRDPRRAGLQLFYSSNISGRFAAPIQVTDTGTVFDSSHADLTSFHFLIAADGAAHVAFVANVDNHLRLFYTSNARGSFARAVLVAEQTKYSLALDSAGRAHIAWVEVDNGWYTVSYWSSASGMEFMIGSVRCTAGSICRIGDIEAEVSQRGVEIFLSADSASVYHTRWSFSEGAGSMTRLPIPAYDEWLTRLSRADLRMRAAVDTFGGVHIVMPRIIDGKHRLLYASNSTNMWKWSWLTTDTLPAQVLAFDVSTNGADRLGIVWTTDSVAPWSRVPRISASEFTRASRYWSLASHTPDIRSSADAGSVWRTGARIAVTDGAAMITGLSLPDTMREFVVEAYAHTGTQPRLAYLHPDAAAPGMNVVVEAIAPARAMGSFGADGFHRDTVVLRLINPRDSSRVIIGPSVVSWQGRLVSTMVFVRPGATPGPVPLAVSVNRLMSGVDTFFVVEPQRLGDSTGVLHGGGALGSGGEFGVRSRRGVLVVDSLIIASGTYTVDTNDCDPGTPGNQGFLPVTIVSKGRVRIDSSATLSVSAENDAALGRYGTAGPGGGGGGSGGWIGGGTGYSGGGGPGAHVVDIGASLGSGPSTASGRFAGAPSLALTPGGVGVPGGPGGGGLGHPFGAAGSYGRMSENEPTRIDGGGFGGGTAGSRDIAYASPTSGGGGGGHAQPGGTGNQSGQESNGGWSVGSNPIVPLAGGSGGGGGGFTGIGLATGGGGGGALAILSGSSIEIAGRITADGEDGWSNDETNASGGGGGAGGSIILAAKESVKFVPAGGVSALGGIGGIGHLSGGRNGGRGGEGRLRIDGRAPGKAALVSPLPSFRGPATGANGEYVGREGTTIHGTGQPRSRIRLYVRPEKGRWDYSRPREVIVAADSTWSIKLGSEVGNGLVYLAALQQVDRPSNDPHASEPEWVMSAAGGNVLGTPTVSIAAQGHDFGCIRLGENDSARIWISNTGEVSDLVIRDLKLRGVDTTVFSATLLSNRVPAGDSVPVILRFVPGTVGRYDAVLTVYTNAMPEGEKDLAVSGCAVIGELQLTPSTMDFGSLCAGACRDTIVRMTNVGSTTLTIEEIEGDEGEVDVTPLDGRTTWTIEPGESIDLALRICIHTFDDSGLRIRFETDGQESRRELTIFARSARPLPAFTKRVVFPNLNVGRDPTACSERSVMLRNLNPDAPLVLRSVRWEGVFAVLSAPVDQPIAPGDSAEMRMTFCPGAAGDFSGVVHLTFDDGSCQLDTTIDLFGRASDGTPALKIVEPLHRLLQFNSTIVDQTSEQRRVVLSNEGQVGARIFAPVLQVTGSTMPDEIAIIDAAVYPAEVAAQGWHEIAVELRPTSVGRKEGLLIFQSEDGTWTDTVFIVGMAVRAGMQLVLSEHDFGAVRLGDVSDTFLLEVRNAGTAPDAITSILWSDGHFQPVFAPPVPPVPMDTGAVVVIPVVYTPSAEQRDRGTVEFGLQTGGTLRATFDGRGVTSRMLVEPTVVDFGAVRRNTVVDLPVAFRITNSGGYPLVVRSVMVEEGAQWFELIGSWRGPDSVFPGQFRSFGVRYRGTHHDVTGRIRIVAEGFERVVDMRGTIQDDPVEIRIAAGSAAGLVGDLVEIPVSIEFGEMVAEDLSYRFTLSFAPGLLVPRAGARRDALPAPLIDGTISSAAAWDVVATGSVTVSGTIPGGSSNGIMVRVPMKALMGPPMTTSLALSNTLLGPGLFSIVLDSGVFTGVDCDTGLAVVAKGRYGLAQNAPNPFNPLTVISYSVAARERVRIVLYDQTGTVKEVLLDGVKEPGIYQLVIDASEIGSGVYTYEMTSGPYRASRRMVVLE